VKRLKNLAFASSKQMLWPNSGGAPWAQHDFSNSLLKSFSPVVAMKTGFLASILREKPTAVFMQSKI
jgi:hypothetical protein